MVNCQLSFVALFSDEDVTVISLRGRFCVADGVASYFVLLVMNTRSLSAAARKSGIPRQFFIVLDHLLAACFFGLVDTLYFIFPTGYERRRPQTEQKGSRQRVPGLVRLTDCSRHV